MSAQTYYQQMIVAPTLNAQYLRADLDHMGNGKPAELKKLHPFTYLKSTDMRQFDQQFQLDAAIWYGAISTGPYSMTLRKIFHLFFYAGIVYRIKRGWADWSDANRVNVASLLSHGQRVMVQLPNTRMGGGEIWAWLNDPNPIPHRGFATHGLSHLWFDRALIRGHKRHLHEDHKTPTGALTSTYGAILRRHYAFNPALGGAGNRNPFSATNRDHRFTPIQANGLNGHVYIYYMPPHKRFRGGMLIGCENAEHGKGKNPHTGAGHGLGTSQKVSSCGGKKWSALGCGPYGKYHSLICDLSDRDGYIKKLIERPLFDPDFLDRPTRHVPPVIRG